MNFVEIKELHPYVLRCLTKFGLEATIKINSYSNKSIIKSTSNHVSIMEKSVLEKANKQDKQFHFNHRSLFHYNNITVLVNNMPVNNDDFYQRIIELVDMINKGANAASDAILKNEKLLEMTEITHNQNTRLEQLISTIDNTLDILELEQQKRVNEKSKVMSELIESMHKNFHHLGLTEQQEEQLMQLIINTDAKMQTILDKNEETEQRIEMVKVLINIS
ncbi:MAG: hypothetical protein ABFS32_23300 [Bacteroidota bacterium]